MKYNKKQDNWEKYLMHCMLTFEDQEYTKFVNKEESDKKHRWVKNPLRHIKGIEVTYNGR